MVLKTGPDDQSPKASPRQRSVVAAMADGGGHFSQMNPMASAASEIASKMQQHRQRLPVRGSVLLGADMPRILAEGGSSARRPSSLLRRGGRAAAAVRANAKAGEVGAGGDGGGSGGGGAAGGGEGARRASTVRRWFRGSTTSEQFWASNNAQGSDSQLISRETVRGRALSRLLAVRCV
jgi:hypothetical protein